MKIDTFLAEGLPGAGDRARSVEALGYDTLWSGEVAHDPLLPLAQACASTSRIGLGTAITLALARNPMSTAYQSWDLAAASEGRFVLGIGAQVKAHITRRFSMPWDKPIPQVKDYLRALRAIYHSFQTGEQLHYEGTHYQHTLLTPLFNPGPLPEGHQPQLALAAVGEAMARLAGELCDGVLFHPFTHTAYIDQVSMPALAEGAARAGDGKQIPWRFAYLFLAVGDTEEEQQKSAARIRKQVAFYASTPAYTEVLRLIGREDLQEALLPMSKAGQWDEMSELVTDDILEYFALRGTLEELPKLIAERYVGRADHLASYYPLPEYEPERIADFVAATRDNCGEKAS
ncbi:LLM class F420-dependent oxidoreductase [Nocardioides endophyticus]|uniref:LLM class F420-dependent oxidoreductase n=1 Tax=Nocardioides endophyticus TaxID=1353775 RepID=A0ABP8ZDB1_9ACTN